MERLSEMSDFERDHFKATQGQNGEQNFNQAVNHMMHYNSNSRVKRPEIEPYGHKRAGMNGAASKGNGGSRRFMGQNGLSSKRPERSPDDDLIQQEDSQSPERQPDECSLRRRAAFHAAKASKKVTGKDANHSLPRTIKAQNFDELEQSDEEISEKVGKK